MQSITILAPETNVLDIQNLSVSRSGKVIIRDINLSIKKGEFVGLVGPNGSGKTTLLLAALGILKAQNGMFSLLPISHEGIMTLRKENGIYLMPDGRINIASLPENKIDFISSKISSLKEFYNKGN